MPRSRRLYAVAAGAALVAYVDKTQIAKRPPIEPPRRIGARETMRIDPATRANLELFDSIDQLFLS